MGKTIIPEVKLLTFGILAGIFLSRKSVRIAQKETKLALDAIEAYKKLTGVTITKF